MKTIKKITVLLFLLNSTNIWSMEYGIDYYLNTTFQPVQLAISEEKFLEHILNLDSIIERELIKTLNNRLSKQIQTLQGKRDDLKVAYEIIKNRRLAKFQREYAAQRAQEEAQRQERNRLVEEQRQLERAQRPPQPQTLKLLQIADMSLEDILSNYPGDIKAIEKKVNFIKNEFDFVKEGKTSLTDKLTADIFIARNNGIDLGIDEATLQRILNQ